MLSDVSRGIKSIAGSNRRLPVGLPTGIIACSAAVEAMACGHARRQDGVHQTVLTVEIMAMIQKRVEDARAGINPTVICRMPSGWAVLGDVQFLRGYSLLLPDPVVPDLNALDVQKRAAFLLDMTTLGDALLEVTGAYRINYEILGNTEPELHAHLFPRHMTEPEDRGKQPAWFYEKSHRESVRFDHERDKRLMQDIADAVQRRG
jgi:diadenosine tetraphosphate (Ap4A) HIT family hydrolase